MLDDMRTSFTGRVVSVVPGYPEWHNVSYDNDPAIYVYKLADDYALGDFLFLLKVSNINQNVCYCYSIYKILH